MRLGVICSLFARWRETGLGGVRTHLRCAPCLRPVGMFPYLSPQLLRSGCSCGSTVRDACSRTYVLSVPGSARSVALAVCCWTRAGWQWGSGRSRLAIAHWVVEPRPRPTRLGMLCSLLGESAWLECTTAELSASCLDPAAMCLSPSPVLLRIGLLVRFYCCVACLLCGAASIDPRTIEAPGTCSALRSAWHLQCAVCAQAHQQEGDPPLVATLALLVRMNSTGGLLRKMGCLGCHLSRIS